MENLTQAVQVAVFVREYLRENTMLHKPDSKEITENYQRICEQLRKISSIK